MNMNDKEWSEFWDHEQDDDDDDEDEDEYNGVGNDVDANNDETFDNAAEWNEDEHEELIARDSILSHRNVRASRNSIGISSNNASNNSNNSHTRPYRDNSDVNRLINIHFNHDEPPKRSGWSPFGGKNLFTSPESPTSQVLCPNLILDNSGASLMQQQQILLQQRLQQQAHPQLSLEQQQQILIQQHLLQQQQHQQQQQQQLLLLQQQQQRQQTLQQMAILRQQQVKQEQKLMSQNPQCFTVEELERQLFANRNSNNNNTSSSSTPTNQHDQQHQPQPQQSKQRPTTPTQHYALLAMAVEDPRESTHKVNSIDPQKHDLYSNIAKKNNRHEGERTERFVDRLERDYRDREGNNHRKDNREHHRDHHKDHKDYKESRDHRDNHRDNYRDHRDNHREHRDNHREHREHHRDHYQRHNLRRSTTIIPPQVQLKVIDETKGLHSIKVKHPDEFLQDKKPSLMKGFHFKRYSKALNDQKNHDGILTEKERNWLTKIQEKIQADYDDNIDQDYYYLLYFNRSSMTDEATQKPSGPGVFDRRFIPRERLLYNSNT